jgi:hypothetical protein
VDLDAFVQDGYAAIRGALDAGTVAACRELIGDAMERRGASRDDPAAWPPLVQGVDDLSAGPFRAAYLAPAGFTLDGSDPSPVAQAIVKCLAMAD